MLRDKEIREALRSHLLSRRPAALQILDELRIHNGNAIADMVAFYKDMHCYEIKGETDSIARLTRQAEFYDEAFPKVTAVIAENHLKWASKNLPLYWGIMIAIERKGKVIFKYHRKASTNPQFAKDKALMILWKDELIKIAKEQARVKVKSSHTRRDLALLMSPLLKKDDTLASIRKAVLSRAS